MSTDIDIRQALRVFQIIVENGQQRGNRHYFKGIYATSGFDGYDVELTDEKVTLSIYFHSRFDSLTTKSKSAKHRWGVAAQRSRQE